MPIMIGTNSVSDAFIGTDIVDKVYVGNQLVLDTFNTIEGNLPLKFNGKAQGHLKNYNIFGTSAGAGIATESGEPSGYKIPLLVTSGATSDSYNLYIGSTKLEAEEYLDFEEQKIYKRTANLWNSDIEQGTIVNGQNQSSLIAVRSENESNVLTPDTYTLSTEENELVQLSMYDENGNYQYNDITITFYCERITQTDRVQFMGCCKNFDDYDSLGYLTYRYADPIPGGLLTVDTPNVSNNPITTRTFTFYMRDLGDGLWVRPYVIKNSVIYYGNQVHTTYTEQVLIANQNPIYAKIYCTTKKINNQILAGTLYFAKGSTTCEGHYLYYNGENAKNVVLTTETQGATDVNVNMGSIMQMGAWDFDDIGNGVAIRPYIIADGVTYYGEQVYTTYENADCNKLPLTFEVQENRKIRAVFKNEDNSNITPEDVTEIMLNQGSTASAYAPYLDAQTPPAPLPLIDIYKGENTISSTEVLGNTIIGGHIYQNLT